MIIDQFNPPIKHSIVKVSHIDHDVHIDMQVKHTNGNILIACVCLSKTILEAWNLPLCKATPMIRNNWQIEENGQNKEWFRKT